VGAENAMGRSRRSIIVAGLVAVAVAAIVAGVVVGGGREAAPRRAPPAADPLAFVPADADAVFALDTGAPLVALAVEQLLPRVSARPLSAAQIGRLTGGRAAVAITGDRVWLAIATDAPAPRPAAGAAAAKRDGVVVVAPGPVALRAALDRAARPAARSARGTFARRFDGLPASSSARVAFDPRALLARAGSSQLAATPWARSLRDGAAVLSSAGDRLRVPFRLHGDPAAVGTADLPIAPGPVVPRARGRAFLVSGVRDPAQSLRFARSAGLLPGLDVVDRLPGFLRPDLGSLGPQGTVTTSDLFGHVTLRTEPPDPGDWSTKLGRLDALSGLIRVIGLADVRIDRGADGAYAITEGRRLLVRAGVYGRVVVLSDDPRASHRAAAPPVSPPPGAAGGLTFRLRPAGLRGRLPGLVLERLGDLTGWARAERAGMTGALEVRVRLP
jgi:hypothetical protein